MITGRISRLRRSLWLLVALGCLLVVLALKGSAHPDPVRGRVIVDDSAPPVSLSDYRIGVLEKQLAALATKVETVGAVVDAKLDLRLGKTESNSEWQTRFLFGAMCALILQLIGQWRRKPERREAREMRERNEDDE